MKGTATLFVSAPKSYDDQLVVPARDVAFEAEPSLVMNGHPNIPAMWVHGTSSTSATGVQVTDRSDPQDVEIDTHSRFIANGFDDMGGVWRPFITIGVDYFWVAPPGLAPSTDITEYRLGKELIRRHSLRFNPGDYLVSSFNSGIDDALSFTAIMVLTPFVPTGYTILSTADDQDELSVSVGNGFTLSYGDLSVSVNLISTLLNRTPVYLAVSSDGTTASMWVGTSTQNLTRRSLRIPSAQVQRMRFMLGKTHSGKAEATMGVYEFLLADHALSSSELTKVISALASTYGAS